jgi:NADH dehydrogenase [ubiquinone] 1 alpha subcomplex assembly factor 7
LAQKLAARMAASGPIPLYDYMQACLYDPEYGYYKRRNPLGRGGDFITAPEISQVFGELTGLWAGEAWRRMGQPDELRLIELGPGRGTLMADALRALRVLPSFLKSVTVHLIETSEALQGTQRAALASAPCPVFWHSEISEVPPGAAIAIANEFLDCLPVRQYVFEAVTQLWRERMVTFEAGSFGFELGQDGIEDPLTLSLSPRGERTPETRSTPGEGPQPAPSPSMHALANNAISASGYGGERAGVRGSLSHAEDGAILEIRPGATAILEAFAARAAQTSFAALIVDYGYSRPSWGDTVQAVSRHHYAGLFERPGEADLTAHVDFSNLIRRAQALGLSAFGPMPMGEWLLRLGLEARAGQLMSRVPEEKAREVQRGIARLVDPKEMGALFKAAILTGGAIGPLPPF